MKPCQVQFTKAFLCSPIVNIQDLNDDGVIQVVDVVILLDLILSSSESSIEPCSPGDFNNDGKLTVQVRKLFQVLMIFIMYKSRLPRGRCRTFSNSKTMCISDSHTQDAVTAVLFILSR